MRWTEPRARWQLAFATRWCGFFLLWISLGRTGVADLVAGALAAALSAAASLALLPAGVGRLRPRAAARFAGHFAVRSLVAGVEVARRAFSPRLNLHPGFLTIPTRCPPGLSRQAFRAIMSLQPGAVPVAQTETTLVLHCLDTTGATAEDVSADERLFLNAGRAGGAHG